MTELRCEAYTIPAADIGPENPLPVFRGTDDDSPVGLGDNVPDEDRRYMGWRTAFRVLPHRMQDGYSRERRLRDLPAVVLENEFLRATFLPDSGGKLASLIYKPLGRELLHRNPVHQPANLALRTAWLSGGVEWNSGQPGHHYLTCSPVFAARLEGPDGSPSLRIYEWDRVKGFTWQVDFWLPDRSPVLFARTRIVNPHPYEIAMYWWTNVAVDEREDVRVLVPADTALCHAYRGGLEVVPLPRALDRDLTYSMRSPHAADFFSRIPAERRKWIAALDGRGGGFFETSTDRLRGRKLFCWGMGRGGRQWQEFLAAPGHAYIEIQAGLARTQMECVPMPSETEWAWTEAFGYVEADAAVVHAEDWAAAWRLVEQRIGAVVPRVAIEETHARLGETATRSAAERLHAGSGWGALERLRRAQTGEPDLLPPELEFDDSTLGPDQEPWLRLLREGALPARTPEMEPGSLMTQPEWGPLMEAGLSHPAGDHWAAWWHLGNLRLEARDVQGAQEAWLKSGERTPNGWALRNLAVAARRNGSAAETRDLLQQSWETGPKIAPLAIEYAAALAEDGLSAELLTFVRGLPDHLRQHERIMFLWAKAALDTGELDDVGRLFEHEYATIREGEVTLTDLWYAYHERLLAASEGVEVNDAIRKRVRREHRPPRRIDFRMSAAVDDEDDGVQTK